MSQIREVSLQLPATMGSVRASRQAVDTLPLDAGSEAGFNLRLLVTEVVGEILRSQSASDDTISLVISLHDHHVRVVAGHHDPSGTRLALDLPLAKAHGRGQLLFDALADGWGITGDADSLIWLELRLPK